MAVDFKVIIVGRGMMGAAAARHLSGMIDGVALIGPGEPAERKSHHGVFASHYDEARITRSFDDNMVWAMLAARSTATGKSKRRAAFPFSRRRVVCLPDRPPGRARDSLGGRCR